MCFGVHFRRGQRRLLAQHAVIDSDNWPCGASCRCKVLLFGDKETRSLRAALEETARRREKQLAYNKKHGITPETIRKSVEDIMESVFAADHVTVSLGASEREELQGKSLSEVLEVLEAEMHSAAQDLEFEKAASYAMRLSVCRKRFGDIQSPCVGWHGRSWCGLSWRREGGKTRCAPCQKKS